MPTDTFNCTMCGECCRHIDLIPQLSEFDDGTGTCIHLKNNLCDIYETRPDICRVDVMYEKTYSTIYSREDFYRLNEEACKQLALNKRLSLKQ